MGFTTFNARADSIETKPVFKGAWKAGRRCLVLTGGFYEWKKLDAEGKQKQPYAVGLGNKGPMLMAGLWDVWKHPETGWMRSCTIITTDANALTRRVHSRMPVILPIEAYAHWLDPDNPDLDALAALLEPAPDDRMQIYPVGMRVNNVMNDEPALIEAEIIQQQLI